MLIFVVPLKSPRVSNDWTNFSALFERCLRSITSQTCEDHRVIVVGNEWPKTDFFHPKVEFLELDLPIPEGRAGKNADKAKKLLHGFDYAKRYNPQHLMAVDADDCVSKRIAEIVKKSPDCPGWLLNRGYLWKEGSKVAYLNTYNFNHSCGSSAIIRPDLAKHLFEEGPWYKFETPKMPEGIVLLQFPIPGAIYCILNGENIFMDTTRIKSHRTREGGIRYYWRKLLKYRPILVTKKISNEFGLYNLASQETKPSRSIN